MYDCYEEIIHGIKVKDCFILCFVCEKKRMVDGVLLEIERKILR